MSSECSSGNISSGYKQTEVGVIPEDWEVLTLGHVTEYVKGFAFSADNYQLHGIRIIRVSDTTFDGIKEEEGIYIDEMKAKSFRKWSLREGDLIVSTVGSKPPMYDSIVGKATFVQAKDNGALLNQNAVILRSRKWSMGSQRLLHNYLKQKRYLAHIEKIFRGNANQASITLKELFEYPVPLPPTKAEQEAIAEALSDTDAFIESLEQLIAKKSQIKQGAMQELFCPKQGDEVRLLKEVSSLKGRIGWQGLKQTEFTTNDEEPFLITGMNFKDGAIRWNEVYHISEERYGMASDIQLRPDDVLMTKDGTIGKVLYIDTIPFPGKASLNSHLLLFRPIKESYNPKYLYYQLCSQRFKNFVEESKSGTTFFGLSQAAIGDYPVLLPSMEKQVNIATILSDMDSEITKLEEKLVKARQIKQGMMQELLTGRVRLI